MADRDEPEVPRRERRDEEAVGEERDGSHEGGKEDKPRRRSRSRDRERKRSRERDGRGGSRYRSRSRERRHRSRSNDRHRSRRSSRSRDSRDRRRKSRSPDDYRGRRDPPKAAPPSNGPGTGADPFAAIRQPMQTVDPLEIQRLWQEQQLRARQLVLSQQAVSAKSAASKTQREVYVGNLLPGAISDGMLQQIFNTALMVRFPGSNMPGMEPVIKVNIHKDGRYAFVELRTPEMATAAMDLSGQVQFLGQAMSVNRPSGYVDPTKVTAAAAAATTALHAFQTGVTQMPSIPGLPPGAMFPGAPSAYPGLAAYPGLVAAPPMAYAAPPPMAPALPGGVSAVPTSAIRVTGMVGADVLMNDLEYSEVLEDLKTECETHAPGAVMQVKVPRPPQPELAPQLMDTANFGKAFVLFRDAAAAQKARDAIHGRMFSGRAIQVAFITPETFMQA